jgi:hypothetical protein
MTSTKRDVARPDATPARPAGGRAESLGHEILVLDASGEAAGVCVVCRSDIDPGEGVAAVHGGRSFRFKCLDCFTRFVTDPAPFLVGQTGGCCGGPPDESPASEWCR